jgi:hypothetical protein
MYLPSLNKTRKKALMYLAIPTKWRRVAKYLMSPHEFTNKPKSSEQLRLDALKTAKEKASANLAAERKRQQVTKAQQKLMTVQQIKIPRLNVQ